MSSLLLSAALLFPLLDSFSSAVDARNLADLMILHPPRRTPPCDCATRQVDVGRMKIEVCIARSPAARDRVQAYVLEFTGNGTTAQQIVRWVAEGIWKDRAVEVWAVNYPGFGHSSGRARLKHVGPVALAAYDALRAEAGDRPIFVSGASFGAMTATFVAARRPVAGLMLLNPPALREVVIRQVNDQPALLPAALIVLPLIPTELDAIANARHCNVPMFAIVSQQDEVVPAVTQQLIFDAYGATKTIVVMRDATHGDHVSAEADNARREWIDRTWRASVR